MGKTVTKYTFTKGQKLHLDTIEAVLMQIPFATHFQKVPDDDVGEKGNQRFEDLSDIEQCISLSR